MQDTYGADSGGLGAATPRRSARAIPLDGVLERNRFSPLLTAFLALFLAFLLFQVVISPIVIIALLMMQGVAPAELATAFNRLFEEHATAFLTGNTVGQALGLALPAWLFARLHTSRPAGFLRLRRTDPWLFVLGIVGLAGLMPGVQWLSGLNGSIPMPDWLRQFEQSQMDLIEKVLMSGDNVGFNLLALAVTPAICEEMLFRGYAQRQAERGLGVLWGILFSGITFGAYHLRLSQIVPLSVLGIYLAYLTWRTGSLWPSILVHFLNNAFAVVLGAYASTHPELEVAEIEQMTVPWYMALAGLLLFLPAVYAMNRRARVERRPPGSLPDTSESYANARI